MSGARAADGSAMLVHALPSTCSVTATSGDGQTSTSSIRYSVLGMPAARMGAPADDG